MKAVVYDAFRATPEIRDVPIPDPPAGAVRIKVRAAGLCRSDWHGWMGHDPDITLPHIPGHEFSGTVDGVGKGVRKFSLGDRVVAPFVCGCGDCSFCHQGDHQVCPEQTQPGFTHDGCFAEYVVVHAADTNLAMLPNDLEFEEAASLGCRFITAYRGMSQQGALEKGQTIVIYGCGGVGLSCLLIGVAMGATVIAVDINSKALVLAQKLGANFVLDGNDNPADKIQHEFGGAHLAVDALGSEETARNGIKSLRRRGKFIQIGLMTNSDQYLPVDMSQVIAHELEILGSHGMSASSYPELFSFIRQSELPLGDLLDRSISLEELCHALPEMGANQSTGITIVRP